MGQALNRDCSGAVPGNLWLKKKLGERGWLSQKLREVQGHSEDHKSCPRTTAPALLVRNLVFYSLQEWQQR